MPPGFCGPRSLWSTLMLSRIVNRLEEGLIALLLGGMAMITFCQVVARYLFNSGAVWALELTTYLFAWLVLIGASYGVKISAHLGVDAFRSEEHTSELQSLMRISYAVFCLKKKKQNTNKTNIHLQTTSS